jgi:hypothetical protein
MPPLKNIPFYQTHFKEEEEGIERKGEGKK